MALFRFCVDKKAALLAGHDLGPHVDIDVTPDDLGEALWLELVKRLDLNCNPPFCVGEVQVGAPTVGAVRSALQVCVDSAAAQTREIMDRLRAQVAARRIAVESPPQQIIRHTSAGVTGIEYGTAYSGYARPIPYVDFVDLYALNRMSGAERAEAESLLAESLALQTRNQSEIDDLNAKALVAALPALQEAYKAKVAAAEAAAKVEAAENERHMTECAARRLASGYWEAETSSYNDRRYGKPWCAKVTGVDGGKLVYEWGDSTASHGSSGLLRVPCRPGDIVAWGQKDLRRPSSSEHHVLLMEPDGRMSPISRTDAYMLLTEKN